MSRQTATAEITDQRDEPGPSLRITAPESGIQPSVEANVVLGQGRRENCFLLMVTGIIDAVELISVPNVYCKYYYVFGADWRQVGGIEEGISATGYKPSRGHRIVLNTPIEATFSSKNPFRWPQIVLSLYGQDIFGNDVIRGYTATHLPMAPGKIKRKCPLFLPQASTAMQRLIGLFTGRRAEFVDPRILATAESRDVIRVSTQGFVELTLNAVLRDIKKFGYDISAQTMMKFSEFPLDWPLSSNRIGQLTSQEPFVGEKRLTGKGRTIETIQEIEEEQEQSSSGAYQEIVNVETMVEEI